MISIKDVTYKDIEILKTENLPYLKPQGMRVHTNMGNFRTQDSQLIRQLRGLNFPVGGRIVKDNRNCRFLPNER